MHLAESQVSVTANGSSPPAPHAMSELKGLSADANGSPPAPEGKGSSSRLSFWKGSPSPPSSAAPVQCGGGRRDKEGARVEARPHPATKGRQKHGHQGKAPGSVARKGNSWDSPNGLAVAPCRADPSLQGCEEGGVGRLSHLKACGAGKGIRAASLRWGVG
jgi:hypothetical protein